MARGVNKVTLLGNLGKDPEIKYQDANTITVVINIATSRDVKQKDGVYKPVTEWHYVTLYARIAEIAVKYLQKGSKVYVEGELKTERWDDNGVERSRIKIIGRELQMISPRQATEIESPANERVDNKTQQQELLENFDDDIPF